MIYDVDDINTKFEIVARFFAVEDFIIPAPEYMLSERWTDENRIKHGYEKQPDGSWGKLETSMAVYNALQKDVVQLLAMKKELEKQNNALRKINNQLEYGCRVAALQLTKISEITTGDDE